MNRLVQLIAELDQTNQRLKQLEDDYSQRPKRGDIYHKTLKHLKKKKAEWEGKLIHFGKAEVIIYKGILEKDGVSKTFEITLVNVTEDEAKSVVELHGGGTVIESMIFKVDTLDLKYI